MVCQVLLTRVFPVLIFAFKDHCIPYFLNGPSKTAILILLFCVLRVCNKWDFFFLITDIPVREDILDLDALLRIYI